MLMTMWKKGEVTLEEIEEEPYSLEFLRYHVTSKKNYIAKDKRKALGDIFDRQ